MEMGNGLKKEADFARKVKAAAEREMARELALARSLGFMPRQAALSERFQDASGARRLAGQRLEWLEGPHKNPAPVCGAG